jgi:hypothetical protein
MAYKEHEHDFVPPGNDDEQQCDNDCRANWHKCSVCGLSRSQIATEHPDEIRERLVDSTREAIKRLEMALRLPLSDVVQAIDDCYARLYSLRRSSLVLMVETNEHKVTR